MSKKSNYYAETVPRLIKQYKKAVERNLEIIGEILDESLTDDKLFNALKGRKEAGEQVLYYAKEIERLENELNGVDEESEANLSDPLDVQRKLRERYVKK